MVHQSYTRIPILHLPQLNARPGTYYKTHHQWLTLLNNSMSVHCTFLGMENIIQGAKVHELSDCDQVDWITYRAQDWHHIGMGKDSKQKQYRHMIICSHMHYQYCQQELSREDCGKQNIIQLLASNSTCIFLMPKLHKWCFSFHTQLKKIGR